VFYQRNCQLFPVQCTVHCTSDKYEYFGETHDCCCIPIFFLTHMIYILDFIMVDCLVEHHLSQVLIVLLYSVQHKFRTYHDARCVIFLMKYRGISLACVQIFTKYTPYLSISNYLCVGCSEKKLEYDV